MEKPKYRSKAVYLYHCDECEADYIEIGDDYTECGQCGCSTGTYHLIRGIRPDEAIPEGTLNGETGEEYDA